ncbi:hypothetical protein AK812_SmicGene6993 [Symbiodinium microadriaticum]|uniref:Uncharacterized protein n=1 Tax=Symbiodinium microadriaticum TaxID=2951 RepID=A0A1Q9EPV0_SYMMI|nr:hypothetical protein AK812_SmicGene6993 [Symbiodinium microadriaticum]
MVSTASGHAVALLLHRRLGNICVRATYCSASSDAIALTLSDGLVPTPADRGSGQRMVKDSSKDDKAFSTLSAPDVSGREQVVWEDGSGWWPISGDLTSIRVVLQEQLRLHGEALREREEKAVRMSAAAYKQAEDWRKYKDMVQVLVGEFNSVLLPRPAQAPGKNTMRSAEKSAAPAQDSSLSVHKPLLTGS